MKNDIILAGVGGQGILSIAAVIGLAAVENGLFVKQAEVHGMSQRGGDVQSHMRISSDPVASDLIPLGKADLILSVEPMEALRYLPWLSAKGWIVTNSAPFENIADYPPLDDVLNEVRKIKNNVILDADMVARELGSARSGNMVILGAATSFLDIPFTCFEDAVKSYFSRKGDEITELNLRALSAGRELSAR